MKHKVWLFTFCTFAAAISLLSCREDDIPLIGITLDKTEVTLTKGDSVDIIATIEPVDATNPTIVWESSDPYVASVSNGKVTAIKGGTCTITASSKDRRVVVSCNIKVSIDVSIITLSEKSMTIEKGNSKQLTAVINPIDATDKRISWTSSDHNVAIVDSVGNVTAVNGGYATITATSEDGKAHSSCNIIVIVPVQKVQVDIDNITLVRGQEHRLNAMVLPEDATDKTIIWNTSNPEVAVVENGIVKAVGVGDATITATSHDRQNSSTCTVKVENSEIIGYSPYGSGQKW